MNLNNENKTLFIPLYGKALMSSKELFIKDKKAEDIINSIDFDLKDIDKSYYLAMYLSARARVIDDIVNMYIDKYPDLVIIHLGCGLDSRCMRVNNKYVDWYDIDFESVINVRKRYYSESSKYHMIAKKVNDLSWVDDIKKTNHTLVVAEGLMMYLTSNMINNIIDKISSEFNNTTIVFDSYSKLGFRLSKIKNPANRLNANIKYGMKSVDEFLKFNKHLRFVKSYKIMYHEKRLPKIKRFVYEHLYCGIISSFLYKIYVFNIDN